MTSLVSSRVRVQLVLQLVLRPLLQLHHHQPLQLQPQSLQAPEEAAEIVRVRVALVAQVTIAWSMIVLDPDPPCEGTVLNFL